MRTLVATTLTIRHSDPDVRRRGQNLVALHLIMALLTLIATPLLLIQPLLRGSAPNLVVCVLAYSLGAFLARAGRVTLSAWLLVAICLLSLLASFFSSGSVGMIPIFVSCPILLGGLTMRARSIGVVLALAFGMLLLVLLPAASRPQLGLTPTDIVINGVLLSLVAAVMALVGSVTNARALETARQAHQQAEQAAAERDQLNAQLEAQVRERTVALERALQEVQARAAAQAALLEEVGLQRTAIIELSVPVLPVGRDTLVLPLIGALDGDRLHDLQERALTSIQAARARRLILDVTGTPVIDTQVGQGLIGLVQGAKLLGAEVLLVGVRPEVAQTIVSLGIDIATVQTFRDLHAALEQTRPLARFAPDTRRHTN